MWVILKNNSMPSAVNVSLCKAITVRTRNNGQVVLKFSFPEIKDDFVEVYDTLEQAQKRFEDLTTRLTFSG